MYQKMGMKKMMRGAIFLTAASFLSKILSAVYRVPFQNMVGDEGFYVYQQVYPIYGIAMTVALSGLPIFISQIIAEQTSIEQEKESFQALFKPVFWGCFAIFFVLFFGSTQLASLMGDKQLKSLIQVTAFVFLLAPSLSFYRGFFQGRLNMIPTALSQVVEQFIRVAVILLAAVIYQRQNWNLYQMGAAAMSGAILGGIAAYLLLKRAAKNNGPIPKLDITGRTASSGQKKKVKKLRQRLLTDGSMICLYSALLVIFQLVDSFVVKNSLTNSGMQEYLARTAKGIYDRGQPLAQLGLVVSFAFTSSFVPKLSGYIAHEQRQNFEQLSKTYIRLSATISLAASVGLSVLIPYVNFGLFENNKGQLTLEVFVFSIVGMTLVQTYQSIFQSMKLVKPCLAAIFIGILVKIISTGVLTSRFGTLGASIATLLGLTACGSCLLFNSKIELRKVWLEDSFIFKLCGCIMGLIIVLKGYIFLIEISIGFPDSRYLSLIEATIGVMLGASIFTWLMMKIRLLKIREWLTLPFGGKLLRGFKHKR